MGRPPWTGDRSTAAVTMLDLNRESVENVCTKFRSPHIARRFGHKMYGDYQDPLALHPGPGQQGPDQEDKVVAQNNGRGAALHPATSGSPPRIMRNSSSMKFPKFSSTMAAPSRIISRIGIE